ncbi:hypothetical protein EON79_19195 [bacterium]|nr:MAG: hypothetical protein EON79_19195 [bacterium]
MRRTFCACAVSLALLSCGPKPVETAIAKTATPEEKLYVALRAGTYQTNAALESIREATEHIKPLTEMVEGEGKNELLDLLDFLDSSGRLLADHVEEPDQATVAKKFGEADDERLSAIEDLGRAKEDLGKAQELAKELEGALDKTVPEEIKQEHATISASIGEAVGAVEEGLGELKKVGG